MEYLYCLHARKRLTRQTTTYSQTERSTSVHMHSKRPLRCSGFSAGSHATAEVCPLLK